MLRCLIAPKKDNLTGFSTGLTGRSKNLEPTRPVSISALATGGYVGLKARLPPAGRIFVTFWKN